jgi:hypothetical protein
MDTRTPDKDAQAAKEAEQLAEIRARMPEVYLAVQRKAAEIGPKAFGLVRRGLRGESDCFYAMERGRVVGAPFCQAVMADVALQMVHFGVTFVCIWPDLQGEAGNGAA